MDKLIHAVAGAWLAGLARAFGVRPVVAFSLAASVGVAYEVAQLSTGRGTPEVLDAVATAGGALVIFTTAEPSRAPAPDWARVLPAADRAQLDLSTARIRLALRAECDSIARKLKPLPDSLRTIHAAVCR